MEWMLNGVIARSDAIKRGKKHILTTNRKLQQALKISLRIHASLCSDVYTPTIYNVLIIHSTYILQFSYCVNIDVCAACVQHICTISATYVSEMFSFTVGMRNQTYAFASLRFAAKLTIPKYISYNDVSFLGAPLFKSDIHKMRSSLAICNLPLNKLLSDYFRNLTITQYE